MEREVRRVEERSRYEAVVGGEVAGFAEYRALDGATAFTHTVVEDAYEGEGVGSQLVREALEDVRARGERIIPLCPFVQGWVDRHPEFADLVDTEALARRRG